MKRSQSEKSVRSVKSIKSIRSMFEDSERGLDFDEMIKTACNKFNCMCRIVVWKECQTDEYMQSFKQQETSGVKGMNVVPKRLTSIMTTVDADGHNGATSKSEIKMPAVPLAVETDSRNVLDITTVYDQMNHLAEITLNEQTCVPRTVMQILGYILPSFKSVTKISLKKCIIDSYVVYELNKFVPLTSLTEVCFDGSYLPEANYAILLNNYTRLTNLSLSRCRLNDEVCRQIAAKLHFLEPAEERLALLNLSSNHITDVGAKCIGDALRSNRHLRYLNLADNEIGDEGANHILHALTDFPLSYDETVSKRRRLLSYLKLKHEIYTKCLTEWEDKSLDDSNISKKNNAAKKAKKKDKTAKNIAISDDNIGMTRAEIDVCEMVGPFLDPFRVQNTILKNERCYCTGNMVLCYLNLGYNRLSFMTVKNLCLALLYQKNNKKLNDTGLLKVVIDGNNLPVACQEFNTISNLLQNNVSIYSAKFFADKRKQRGRISMVPKVGPIR